jgi:hypothetical protein
VVQGDHYAFTAWVRRGGTYRLYAVIDGDLLALPLLYTGTATSHSDRVAASLFDSIGLHTLSFCVIGVDTGQVSEDVDVVLDVRPRPLGDSVAESGAAVDPDSIFRSHEESSGAADPGSISRSHEESGSECELHLVGDAKPESQCDGHCDSNSEHERFFLELNCCG